MPLLSRPYLIDLMVLINFSMSTSLIMSVLIGTGIPLKVMFTPSFVGTIFSIATSLRRIVVKGNLDSSVTLPYYSNLSKFLLRWLASGFFVFILYKYCTFQCTFYQF